MERDWTDRNDVSWFLCDTCDRPVTSIDGSLFTATVADDRTDDAGAFYCEDCAVALMDKWAERAGYRLVPKLVGVE